MKVLNDGHVRLVSVMGDDAAIVQAARVSYGKGTKTVREDRGLIRYLMRHRHTTPFEMVELKFHVRVPMDTWRQWIRHRTASVNEYSTRYSEAIDSRQTTEPWKWRSQSSANKQGSGEFLPPPVGNQLTDNERSLHEHAEAVYQDRLQAGVAREQARKDLPLSTYTEAYWKIDLHNLFHFLALRMDSHAQWEIRQYANAIASIVKELFPLAWEAFEEYRLGAFSLSATEARYIAALINGCQEDREAEWNKLPGREQMELNDKLHRMGAASPKQALQVQDIEHLAHALGIGRHIARDRWGYRERFAPSDDTIDSMIRLAEHGLMVEVEASAEGFNTCYVATEKARALFGLPSKLRDKQGEDDA